MADKPNKDRSPSFFKGEFSFVNKDAKNIESKDHNAAVSWHVMNRYERWKKQEQARKLRASANVPIGPLSSSTQGSPSGGPRASRSRSRGSPSTSTIPTNTTPTSPFGSDPWLPDAALPLNLSSAMPPSIAASAGFASSAVSSPSTHSSIYEDPFALLNPSPSMDMATMMSGSDVAIPAESPLANKLMSFAYELFIPNIWPTEPGNIQGSYEMTRSWDDAAAMTQDSCYANAYLALLAGFMGNSTDDQSLSYQAGLYKGQCMGELRQRVAAKTGSQDLHTLKAILKLFSAETITDNTAVARVHLKMLRNLVSASGGVILLDSWFREDLLSCDCYFALKYGTRPVLPAAEWTPGPLSQPWKARLVSAGIFGDHAAGMDAVVDHPILKAVFVDLREMFKAQEYILTHEVPVEDQLLRWRQLRRFDCISRLADHLTNLTIYAHLYDFPRTQAMTTIATAILANLVLGCPEPVRFGNRLLEELRTKVTAAEDELQEAEATRLRFWALYVGSLAEKVHPQSTANGSWFESRLKRSRAELKLKGWEDMKRILRQLLFSARLHEEIENGRPFRTKDCTQGLYMTCGTSWREPLTLRQQSEPSEAEASSRKKGKAPQRGS